MLQQQLTKIKDFILQYNSYYDKGYDSVVMDDFTGQINNGDETIFPADNVGNFFYLRLPNDLIPDYQLPPIADNYLSIGVAYNIILVAYMDNGDSSKMLENLITTLGRYQDEQLKMTKLSCNIDSIVKKELFNMGKENLNAAIQRFPNGFGLCSISFTFTIPFVFQKLTCLEKPCLNC
jgi:hypothetical protein